MATIDKAIKFNRLYENFLHNLGTAQTESSLNKTEIKVISCIKGRKSCTANDICRKLSLDAGYLCRVIKGLEERGYVQKAKSATDKRANELVLTDKGIKEADALSGGAEGGISAVLDSLSKKEKKRLVFAMEEIIDVLSLS